MTLAMEQCQADPMPQLPAAAPTPKLGDRSPAGQLRGGLLSGPMTTSDRLRRNVSGEPALSAQLIEGPLLGGLDVEVARELAGSFDIRSVAAGELLTNAGRRRVAPALGIILSGQAKSTWVSIDGARSSTQLLLPGEIFGSRVKLSSRATTAAPRAGIDSRIATLDAPTLDHLTTVSPTFAHRMNVLLARELAWARASYNDLAFLDTGARLAKLLLRLDDAYGQRLGDRVHVEHHLNQTELGQVIVASRETVCKILSEFEARGWIEVDGRSFVITHRSGLEQRHNR